MTLQRPIRTKFLCLTALWSCLALSALFPVAGTAAEIYSVFYDNRFGTIDDTTGAFSQIGTLPFAQAGGIAYDNGSLYAEGLNGTLVYIDPVSGAASILGSTGLQTNTEVFAGGDNGLYEIDSLSDVYSINPETGAAVLAGATGLPPNYGSWDTSLSDDGTNLYFTAGSAGLDDYLYEINTATGVATSLGDTGVSGIAGSAIVNGQLELFQYHWSGAVDYVYTAPLGATDFTALSVLSTQVVDGGTLLEAPSASNARGVVASPEPSPLPLMCSGLAAIALAGWRKKALKGIIRSVFRL